MSGTGTDDRLLTLCLTQHRGIMGFDVQTDLGRSVMEDTDTATVSAWCGRCYGFTNQTRNVCHSCNDVVPADDDHDSNDLGRS